MGINFLDWTFPKQVYSLISNDATVDYVPFRSQKNVLPFVSYTPISKLDTTTIAEKEQVVVKAERKTDEGKTEGRVESITIGFPVGYAAGLK